MQTIIIGWIGENAIPTTRLLMTQTPYKAYLLRFHILTIPSSPPVARRQYRLQAEAHVIYSWHSRKSLIISNSDSSFLSYTMMRPSIEQQINSEWSFKKMIFMIYLFSNLGLGSSLSLSESLDSSGDIFWRKSPVSEQYYLTYPAASPTKNRLFLYPNSAAVMLVS